MQSNLSDKCNHKVNVNIDQSFSEVPKEFIKAKNKFLEMKRPEVGKYIPRNQCLLCSDSSVY